MSKRETLSSWKNKVWKEFSKYIRLKYSVKGICSCYTCGTRKHWKSMQAGHGLAGRGNSILFEEDVVRPQCYGCNICASGRLDDFTYRLRLELGEERFEELYIQKSKPKKYTIPDLKELHLSYKEKVKELEGKL